MGIADLDEEVRLLRQQQATLSRALEEKKRRSEIQQLTMENTLMREQLKEENSEDCRGRSRIPANGRRLETPQEVLEGENQTLSRLQATRAVQQPREFNMIRLKDIDKLKLDDLSKVTSKQKLKKYFASIEVSTSTEEGRINGALFRMDHNVSSIVEDEIEGQNIQTWAEFKQKCYGLFTVPMEINKFLQELNTNYTYHIDLEPRNFANRLKVLFSSVNANGLPDRDLTIKQKLYDGLTPQRKAAMKILMLDTKVSLESFIKELENQRNMYHQESLYEKKIREVKEMSQVRSPEKGVESATSQSEMMANLSATICEEFRKGQESLVRALESNQPRRPKYCGYCNVKDQHWSRFCPQNPPPNSCFDCWKVGHRRNDPGCPKKKE